MAVVKRSNKRAGRSIWHEKRIKGRTRGSKLHVIVCG